MAKPTAQPIMAIVSTSTRVDADGALGSSARGRNRDDRRDLGPALRPGRQPDIPRRKRERQRNDRGRQKNCRGQHEMAKGRGPSAE